MEAENAGFHHQHGISFKSGTSSGGSSSSGVVSPMISMGNYYNHSGTDANLSLNDCTTGQLGNYFFLAWVVHAGNSFWSSLLLDSAPELKHDTRFVVEWSVEEYYKLEGGLAK
ncbi:Uncharacterized protein Adt_15367 [Abeliophyllum distichum]|uniref:Uncharacterized protein n=1 Tax=Abeliophyllum distichum TaxID=126358 RepID=A0ABD1U292_9LAMI